MPVARRWFTGHEAWLVGAALGYLVSSLAASVLLRFELATPSAVLAISVVVLALALRFMGAGRIETSELPWLTVAWLVVMLIVVVPFSRVGASVADGVAYRAYFSADLMTHLSVVAELQKGGFPLHNPFYQGAGLGYYWLFFTLPGGARRLARQSNRASRNLSRGRPALRGAVIRGRAPFRPRARARLPRGERHDGCGEL